MTTELGTDISTPDGLDLDPQFTLVSGIEALGSTSREHHHPTGALIDDDSWGFDVRAWLNDTAPSASLAAGARAVAVALR